MTISRAGNFLRFNKLTLIGLALGVVVACARGGRATDVVVTRLDGSSVTGELRDWTANEVALATQAGEERLPTGQLLSIRWAGENRAVATLAKARAELLDGTVIPVANLQTSGKTATLTLERREAENDTKLEVPTAEIATVRFQEFDSSLEKQWEEIRGAKAASDVLVILKREGKSLDFVEGVVGDISQDKVQFKLDDEAVEIDRAKLAGIIYLRTSRAPSVEAKVSVHGRSGFRADAADLQLASSSLIIRTISGNNISWPLDDIEVADFSAGKLTYLSDLEPSQDWSPLVGVPAGATVAAAYGQPRRDRSAFGGKLSLQFNAASDADGSPGETRVFEKGIAVRSRTELVYRLPVGYNRFHAISGIDPATSASGSVRLGIYADDRSLLETEVSGSQPPQAINVDITGAKRLKIVVDYGQNLDTGDWVNLCDAKIVK